MKMDERFRTGRSPSEFVPNDDDNPESNCRENDEAAIRRAGLDSNAHAAYPTRRQPIYGSVRRESGLEMRKVVDRVFVERGQTAWSERGLHPGTGAVLDADGDLAAPARRAQLPGRPDPCRLRRPASSLERLRVANHAAVDVVRRTGDVGRVVGREEDDGVRNLPPAGPCGRGE